MFMRARKRIMKWLRDSDFYDEWGDLNIIEVSEENQRAEKVEDTPQLKKIAGANAMSLSSTAMHFKVFKGAGGIVIETWESGNGPTRDDTSLHIIPEGEDLATAIAHIITLQSMRR